MLCLRCNAVFDKKAAKEVKKIDMHSRAENGRIIDLNSTLKKREFPIRDNSSRLMIGTSLKPMFQHLTLPKGSGFNLHAKRDLATRNGRA